MSKEVMIIDDEADMLEIMGFILSSKGYRVRTAQDGREAIDHLETACPDFIFLDLEMPVVDGFEVCEHIKKHPRFREIPIFIITACTLSGDDQKRLKKMQVQGCVSKPFEVEEIFSLICQWS